MEIKIKFNLGQEVFFMKDNKINEGHILGASIVITKNIYEVKEIKIKYEVELNTNAIICNENLLYGTKQELVDNL